MAQLPMPDIDFGGDGPQNVAALVTSSNIMRGGAPAIYTRPLLTIPAVSQLVAPAPVPDSGLFVWQRSIVDSAGNVLGDARVEVRHAETNSFAEIYADRDGEGRRSNPFLVDSEGFARFYAAAGLYNVTASRAGLERVFENVLLGVRLEDMPDLTSIVQPIIDDILDPLLADLDEQVAALPELVGFRLLPAGTLQSAPDGYSGSRSSVGAYRVTHNAGTPNYHVKLTVWDPSSDRVYSATMSDQQSNYFDFRVRSIYDEASASDATVDIELTF